MILVMYTVKSHAGGKGRGTGGRAGRNRERMVAATSLMFGKQRRK
jgi:hypothetical protein